MKKVAEILKEHLAQNHLKLTKQRETIVQTFLKMERHITAEELYREVFKKNPSIGIATVYRTLHLLCECGVAQQRQFGEGQTRYDPVYNKNHHDHLICNHCGKIIEFENSSIEKLQEKVASQHRFTILSHKLELYGLCVQCKT
jgi:Fur family ferric uptake transcriptional regulator